MANFIIKDNKNLCLITNMFHPQYVGNVILREWECMHGWN